MAEVPGEDGGAVDPRDPHDDADPWSKISFDEDFVKASNITELAAAERLRAGQKAAAKDAARRRRRERRRRAGVFVRRYTLIWVAIAIVAVLGVMGAQGSGPLGRFLHVRSADETARLESDDASRPMPSTSSTSSTSTTFVLLGADHLEPASSGTRTSGRAVSGGSTRFPAINPTSSRRPRSSISRTPTSTARTAPPRSSGT